MRCPQNGEIVVDMRLGMVVILKKARVTTMRQYSSGLKQKETVPIRDKYTLTISEASEYFNIGEKKLRQIVQENNTADFILNNGVKVLIKRMKFEQFIDEVSSI